MPGQHIVEVRGMRMTSGTLILPYQGVTYKIGSSRARLKIPTKRLKEEYAGRLRHLLLLESCRLRSVERLHGQVRTEAIVVTTIRKCPIDVVGLTGVKMYCRLAAFCSLPLRWTVRPLTRVRPR